MRDSFRKTLTSRLLASTALASALALTAPAVAGQVLPTGGSVASGSASISTSGSAMTIQQTTPRAVVNWNSFSVGAPNSVTFAQPDPGSATLNRVLGSTPSSIAGQINANGQVYLVNPNGIAITKSGTVNVGGGFVASTLGITDTDFNNGKLKFNGAGASAAVSNDGTITTGPGGIVGLIGGSVSNSGTITAPLGRIALGSGEQATLDLTGDGFLQVALPTNATTADGKALVDVSGTVKAAGGRIAIKAATAANAVRNAINLTGIASARSARKVGGSIVLGGGDGGDVNVAGALDASGRTGGGSVAVTGHKVALRNATLTARSANGAGGAVAVSGTGAVKLVRARLDVSGATGGGTISVGGSPRGLGPLVNAASATVSNSVLRADALTSGNGGAITVWSRGATSVTGALTARGGALSGNGGTVETSGHILNVAGAKVDAGARFGKSGSWLLDPTDLIVDPAAATAINGALGADTNVTLTTFANGAPSAPFTLSASETNASGTGDIYINSSLAWSTAATLTLNAYNDIVVNANISVQGAGNVVLNTGVGNTAVPGSVQFALNDVGPTASLTYATGGGALTINNNVYTLLRAPSDLALITATPSGHFALANDINAATAPATPITTSLAADFTGALDGLGHSLSNLTVNQGVATQDVGLFGVIGAAGVVSNLFLTNVKVTGGSANDVGAIAGENDGLVLNSGASGSVSSNATYLGGLVGYNTGLVLQTSNSVAVTGGQGVTNNYVGGVVGYSSGGVVTSFASGSVTGDDYVGGVAGSNVGYLNGGSAGAITGHSYVGGVAGQNLASENGDFVFNGFDYGPAGFVDGGYVFGDVAGAASDVGGAVGQNFGTVRFTFSNATVSGVTSVGGLVGENENTISTSYAIGQVSGTTNVGGLVGYNLGVIDSTFAMGAVVGTTDVGGLVGLEGGTFTTISNSYSTGFVSGTNDGFVGAVGGTDDTITNGYWDMTTSGQKQSAGVGPQGLTTTQLQTYPGPTGFSLTGNNGASNFAGGAAGNGATGAGEANVYPYLTNFFPSTTAGVQAVSGVAYNSGSAPLASTAAAVETVYLDTAGSVRNHSTTGANGYYYIFLDPATLATGAHAVVYTVADAATPAHATNAATYIESIAAPNTTPNIYNIYNATLTETTALPTYSSLVMAVTNATAGDAIATGAIAGVSIININSTVANFTVDTAISTAADLTITGTQTTLAANVTATGGVNFDTPVVVQSSATVTENSGSATTTFSSTLAVDAVGLTVSGAGALVVTGAATVAGVFDLGGFARTINTVNLAGGTLQDGALTGAVVSTGGFINALTGPASVTTTAGTTTLSGTNGYTGATTITGGTLTASSANAFSAVSATAISAGGVVNLGGFAQTITAVNLNGGALQSGGLTGAIISTGGSIDGIVGSPTLTTTSGTTTLSGTNLFASVTNGAAATIVNDGVTTDDLNNAGAYTNNGTENANVASNTGTITNGAGAFWNGNVDAGANTAGGLITNLGTWTGTGNNAGGTLDNSAAWVGAIDNTSGAFNNDAGATVSGLVTNAGTGTNAGTIASLSNTAGTFSNSGTIGGLATVTGGTLTTTGAINGGVANSATVNAAGTIGGAINNNAGTFTVTGALASDGASTFSNAAGATLDVKTGAFTNLATLSNAGAVTVEASLAAVTINNSAGATLNATGSVATTGVFTNAGTANLGPALFGGAVTNSATMTVSGASVLDGNVTNTGALAFNAPVTINANLTIDSTGGSLSFGSTIDSGTTTSYAGACYYGCAVTAAYNLTITGGSLSFGGAIGGQYALGALSITAPGSLALPAVTADTIFARSTGADITLDGVLTASGSGTAVTLAAAGAFINDAGANAIVLTGDPPNWLIYSNNPTADSFGGLNSNNYAIFNTPYPAASPPTNGDYYLFAYQPTVTFTSINDSKIYGQDVTARVATDYTVSGIVPADPGVYLGGTASGYSGTPSVTSAGSPATAPVAGSPYTINVAQGSVIAQNGYALAFVSSGQLTIAPEPITVTATTNTKVYNATTAAAATPTVTTGTLYDAATLSETYSTPNVGTGLTLTPQIAFTTPAAANNYTVTLTPAAVGTITPEPFTVTAAANTKVYNATTAAAATPTVTTGTLYDAATLSETYATPNAGTGLTLNPQIAFAAPAAASNYTVTLAPAAVGTITPEPITVTATTNAKVYNATTAAAATPTVTAGALYDAVTLSETYATPNAGTGLTLSPQIAFTTPGAANNYTVTLTPAQVGTITPEPITVTATTNAKVYNATTAAAATPTLTAGTLFDPVTLSETYATPNAGTTLTLNPQIAFATPAVANNYTVTLAPAQIGTITPEPLTVAATPNTKFFDGTTSAAAQPVLTAGTLFDPATLSETYATPGPGNAINLIPAIAFNSATTAGDYAVTLVPTGTRPPYTGSILPPTTLQINLSPSVFVNRNPLIGIPGDASTCGPDVQLPDPSSFADPVAAVQAISAATSQYVERCRDASQEDIANALDRYADALQVIIQKLPPKLRVQLQHIPALVRAAAVRARAAPTRAAAVRVLRQTVAMVHHEITLVRADDPDSARVRNAVSTGVSGVLNSAAVALARSEGI